MSAESNGSITEFEGPGTQCLDKHNDPILNEGVIIERKSQCLSSPWQIFLETAWPKKILPQWPPVKQQQFFDVHPSWYVLNQYMEVS
jgi:ribosomal protein L11 methylase PrmA